jgi:hypothetical protein
MIQKYRGELLDADAPDNENQADESQADEDDADATELQGAGGGRQLPGDYSLPPLASFGSRYSPALVSVAPPVCVRYNPPFTSWLIRRNEMLVEVSDPREQAPSSIR